MFHQRLIIASFAVWICVAVSHGAPAAEMHTLLTKHCGKCHTGDDPEADFHLDMLGSGVTPDNQHLWQSSMELVSLGDMPPSEETQVGDDQRDQIARYIRQVLLADKRSVGERYRTPARRLNNREFAKSLSDALGIEDPGTHYPLGNLLGDTLHDGFDTNGDALGISQYHLEQYIESARNVLDATILEGEKPVTKHYVVDADTLNVRTTKQLTTRQDNAGRNADSVDIRDPRTRLYFANFQTVPKTGYYDIKIRATGIDRGYYDSDQTGVYAGDPIALKIHIGDRTRTFDLPDGDVKEIQLTEWLAKGTRVELTFPTDGLRQRGNANFKFQYGIAHDYIQKHDPDLYRRVSQEISESGSTRRKEVRHWSHWVKYWRGPRPRVFGAEIFGPIYRSWPPERQTALVGESPTASRAESILQPIAQKAWRREIRDGELEPIVRLVQSRQQDLGDLGAIKEGLVAVFASPSFLLINPEVGSPAERFATKLTYFFESTLPDQQARSAASEGKLDGYPAVRRLVHSLLTKGSGVEFINEFPLAWLQLERINFMAPDPDHFPHYHRKSVSDDMIAEVQEFFRHAVRTNMPVPEMLTADFSFINADLAKVYGIKDVPDDSKLRKHTFDDGHRGGLLGMGAFLTLTADSLGTSPIHRAVYVLENFMGIKPAPPPGDVEIQEPDVRQAKTIKEILNAHVAESTCSSCHRTIDPYGYAFENFDPMGGWRDQYVTMVVPEPTEAKVASTKKVRAKRAALPIDPSAQFRNGKRYQDIVGFRKLMKSKANQEQFVRCFIKKLLMYANGAEPEDASEIEKILAKSAEHDYGIIDTIAAVIDSPLFREP